MQTDQTYKVEYDIFMKEYKKGVTDGESVGRMIARMAQFFSEINNKLCDAETDFCRKANEVEDEVSSSSKAKVIYSASDEARKLRELKTDLKNVEQYLNSLKSLQKGISNEYQFAGL